MLIYYKHSILCYDSTPLTKKEVTQFLFYLRYIMKMLYKYTRYIINVKRT